MRRADRRERGLEFGASHHVGKIHRGGDGQACGVDLVVGHGLPPYSFETRIDFEHRRDCVAHTILLKPDQDVGRLWRVDRLFRIRVSGENGFSSGNRPGRSREPIERRWPGRTDVIEQDLQ